MSAPNPQRAQVALDGHLLQVSFNGWCALESLLGERMPAPLERMQRGLGFGELRTYVRVFMTDPMTDDEAGEIINRVGYVETLKALAQACEGFFPEVQESAENPTEAAQV